MQLMIIRPTYTLVNSDLLAELILNEQDTTNFSFIPINRLCVCVRVYEALVLYIFKRFDYILTHLIKKV